MAVAVRALGFELKKEEIKSIFEELDKVRTTQYKRAWLRSTLRCTRRRPHVQTERLRLTLLCDSTLCMLAACVCRI